MSAERITYLDSSAIVKLVVREPESGALSRYLHGRRPVVSSILARVEVVRATSRLGALVAQRARDVLARLELVRVNDRVVAIAGVLAPPEIRSLDAIHLATASLFGKELRCVVTYDARMSVAARGLGWRVVAPA